MSENHPPTVDSLDMLVPTFIFMLLFAVLTGVSEATIGPAWTYGGDLCADTQNIVVVCGAPPVGLVVAGAIALVATLWITGRIRQKLEEGIDEDSTLP